MDSDCSPWSPNKQVQLECREKDFQVVLINCPNLSLTALSRFYSCPDRRRSLSARPMCSVCILTTADLVLVEKKRSMLETWNHRVFHHSPCCTWTHSASQHLLLKKIFNLKFIACSLSSLKLCELPKNCIKFPSHFAGTSTEAFLFLFFFAIEHNSGSVKFSWWLISIVFGTRHYPQAHMTDVKKREFCESFIDGCEGCEVYGEILSENAKMHCEAETATMYQFVLSTVLHNISSIVRDSCPFLMFSSLSCPIPILVRNIFQLFFFARERESRAERAHKRDICGSCDPLLDTKLSSIDELSHMEIK